MAFPGAQVQAISATGTDPGDGSTLQAVSFQNAVSLLGNLSVAAVATATISGNYSVDTATIQTDQSITLTSGAYLSTARTDRQLLLHRAEHIVLERDREHSR